MAFVPFVESDQPTMAAFNEKFQQNYEAAVDACAKIEEGTYTGTGGSKTLAFSFVPKIVFITSDKSGNLNSGGVNYPICCFAIYGSTRLIEIPGNTSYAPEAFSCAFSENFVTFDYVFNRAECLYHYVAFA